MSTVAHVEQRDLSQYGNPSYYWGDPVPGLAELVIEADSEPDEDARNALYRSALGLITDHAADGWLFVLPALSIVKTGTDGYPETCQAWPWMSRNSQSR